MKIVDWIQKSPENALNRSVFEVPVFAEEICSHHRLWMFSPLNLSIPILCGRHATAEEKITAWPYPQSIADWSLDLLVNSHVDTIDYSSSSSKVLTLAPGPSVIRLATVFEYVEASYDKGMMPLLLAAIPEHDRAETLIPAVFGVPLVEFTEGWHDFLAERYKITR